MSRQPVAVIVGTRPEAIKMAPVIRELSRSKLLRPITVLTSQHRELVGQVFRSFGIKSDHDLRVMRRSQTLWNLSARLAKSLGEFFDRHPVAATLVQGDTSTAFFGGGDGEGGVTAGVGEGAEDAGAVPRSAVAPDSDQAGDAGVG